MEVDLKATFDWEEKHLMINNAHIAKPFYPDDLFRLLYEVLKV